MKPADQAWNSMTEAEKWEYFYDCRENIANPVVEWLENKRKRPSAPAGTKARNTDKGD